MDARFLESDSEEEGKADHVSWQPQSLPTAFLALLGSCVEHLSVAGELHSCVMQAGNGLN